MRKYDYKGNLEQLRTLPKEITVGDFETITKLQQESPGDYTYYLSVFELLGLSEELVDNMTADVMFTIIRDFQKDFTVDTVFTKEVKMYSTCCTQMRWLKIHICSKLYLQIHPLKSQ